MSSEKKSYEPVFVIGIALFAVQLFWFLVNALMQDWYQSEMLLMVSVATSLAVPILCAYFVKDTLQRSILIVLIFLSVLLRMSERLMF